ncbi:MAG: hypothetical protein LAO79_28165 [Acidobacteriia bacterium]|nr:hypothetical protein [Terriglobia bacterium]
MGVARRICTDEWCLMTPLFQAAVRNKFERINRTSFYNEDLRNFYALPLRDWGLIFRPQLWLFFIASPARAYSFYFAFLFSTFLIGYGLFFRELGISPAVSAAAALAIYFCGYSQFWWTTVAPLLAGFAWIAWILLRPMKPVVKFVALAYTFAWWMLSHFYVPFLAEIALTTGIVVLAFRPRAIRVWRAIVPAALVGIAIVYAYFAGVIPVMRATIYPGHRTVGPGLVHPASWASQFYPLVDFDAREYESLIPEDYRAGPENVNVWWNISEVASVGSYLPILALCLVEFRRAPRRPILILLAGFALMTFWELAPAPMWLGRLLYWNHAPPQRLLFCSGMLLTLASLAVLRSDLVSITPVRVAIFVMAGPAAGLLLKRAIFGMTDPADSILCAFFATVALAVWLIPARMRPAALIFAAAAANVYAFGRFNPVQSAKPIFDVPETARIQVLRANAEENSGFLAEPRFLGATLNGLGFKSVSHVLMSPQLEVFRAYFPTMDAAAFEQTFNRFAHVEVADVPVPSSPHWHQIRVPAEAFRTPRNLREAIVEEYFPGACEGPRVGAIEQFKSIGTALQLSGWARWRGEDPNQGLRILTRRKLAANLETVARPDYAESIQDYRFGKVGFRLTLSPLDHRPLAPNEIVLLGFGTVSSAGFLRGAGCP